MLVFVQHNTIGTVSIGGLRVMCLKKVKQRLSAWGQNRHRQQNLNNFKILVTINTKHYPIYAVYEVATKISGTKYILF